MDCFRLPDDLFYDSLNSLLNLLSKRYIKISRDHQDNTIGGLVEMMHIDIPSGFTVHT